MCTETDVFYPLSIRRCLNLSVIRLRSEKPKVLKVSLDILRERVHLWFLTNTRNFRARGIGLSGYVVTMWRQSVILRRMGSGSISRNSTKSLMPYFISHNGFEIPPLLFTAWPNGQMTHSVRHGPLLLLNLRSCPRPCVGGARRLWGIRGIRKDSFIHRLWRSPKQLKAFGVGESYCARGGFSDASLRCFCRLLCLDLRCCQLTMSASATDNNADPDAQFGQF